MPVVDASASKLLIELEAARKQSDQLFSILKPEFLYRRPIAERHRVIFYLGHLDGFDSIQICREGLGLKSPDQELDALFQAGIDPDSAHLPSDTPQEWPSIDDVRAYVNRCRDHVNRALETVSEDVVLQAVEHRLMHLETLAYMFHNFEYRAKNLALAVPLGPKSQENVENDWVFVPEGVATLGKPHDGQFGWDNEYEETARAVPAFRIQRYSVTNGEYLRFVEKTGAPVPLFWVQNEDGCFFYRGMFEQIPLPLDWPVYLTHDQAAAYARWMGKDLPTEEQFHRAAYASPDGHERPFPWGTTEPSSVDGNFDCRRWDPESVTAAPETQSAWGVRQIVGNGWQWTNTIFAPLPGFRPSRTYPGYSANFFDGEHYVMKGGSAQTAARLLRRSFRNWFRHDYPYMYAGFHCVENL